MDRRGSGIGYSSRDDSSAEEKKSKTDDDVSLSSSEDQFLNKAKRTHYFFENVRFTPKVMEFLNAYEGKQFSEKLTIQNIGKDPVYVKIGEPNSFIFQLKKPTLRAKFLAAGGSICRTVSYTFHNDDLVQRSQIPIHVNGLLVDYPIIVKKAKPEIEVQPQKLHFEVINLGASAKSMTLSIINSGGKRTKFEIDCGNNLDLSVTPMRGTVKPKQSVNVRVEIMGFVEGEYYRELWIKTLEVPLRVPVFVEVVRPRLEIVYPAGTQNFTLIDFEAAFRGTQRIGWLMLKNVSTEYTQFVALAELDGTLEVLKNAKNVSDSFKIFDLVAEEGNLAPFETRVFNVLFCPKKKSIEKGWHHKESEKKKQNKCDHVVFFNIQSISSFDRKKLAEVDIHWFPQLMPESPTKPPSAAASSDDRQSSPSTPVLKQNSEGMSHLFSQNMPEDKPLRFCLHGQIVDPDILIQPTSFDFGCLFLGQTENKVLRITNNSILPVKCKLCKTMNVSTEPEVVWLKREKAQEFLISLTPKCAGGFNSKMKVEILAESDVFGPAKKTLVTVAVHNVNISYIARDPPLDLVPKIGLGITPLVVDEVGFQKDLITFKDASKLPYAAVLGLKTGFKPAWMKTERDQVNNVENAIVALPNDRQGFLQSWPKNKICRSIFTGVFRYSPPEDLTYTLSHEGRIEQKKRREVWDEYILSRLDTGCHPELKTLKREFSGSYLPTAKESLPAKVVKEINSCQTKGVKKPLKFPMIPLSPMFLFHVVVEPKLINFSLVAIATKTEDTITIKNMNDFPVSVRFVPGNESVTVLEKFNLIPAETTKSVKVFLEAKDFGRYFGFLNYVINEAHEFKVTISALVISKTLTLNKKNLCLNFVTCDSKTPKDTFLPNSVFVPLQNILQTPVKYKMNLSDDSIFVLDITEGVIPPKTTLLAEVYLRWCPKKSFYSEVGICSEGGSTQLIKLSYPNKKVAVNFLSSHLDMGDIPLNLPTLAKPEILNNCYHDVSFEVLTSRPMPGVTIFPKEGIIRARSFFHLDVVVQIPVVMEFFFDVNLNVHFSSRISVAITGNVVFPLIRIKPSEVNLRKICEKSFETFTISAINDGTTTAEVKLDFSTCPEFKVIEGPSELTIHPNEIVKFLIRFDPINATRYVFYLPLIINKILGPPMIQEGDSEFAFYYISEHESDFKGFGDVCSSENSKLQLPCVCINCTVTSALLSITPVNVEFQLTKNSEFQPQSIVIANVIDDDVTFCISRGQVGEDIDSPFDVIPVREDAVEYKFKTMRARLRPNEKLVLMATYQPKTYGKHTANVPIFVKGHSNGQVYNLIHLSGMLKAPRITPASSEVYFPALPLGVANEVVLTICAENYTAPDEIKCLAWESPNGDEDSGRKISTKWLTEPIVCESRKAHTFKLQISFQSFVPTALRSYLILTDSMGRYATILVSALTDNSTVTIHSFLYSKITMYKLLRNPAVLPKWKVDDAVVPVKQSDAKYQRNEEKGENRMASKSMVVFDELSQLPESSDSAPEVVEQGPTLVLQLTKSMTKFPQLGFVKIIKNYESTETKNSVNYDLVSNEQKISLLSQSESLSASKAMPSYEVIGKTTQDEVSYPDFPTRENVHWNYFHATINLIERWIYEVVMRCDIYLSIPQSFQNIKVIESKVEKDKKGVKMAEKDFLYFLEEIIGNDRTLPKRPNLKGKNPQERASASQAYFLEILIYLKSKGCLLPHIRAEYLMDYDDYEIYSKSVNQFETFAWEHFDVKGNNSKTVAEPSSPLGNVVTKVTQAPKQNSSVFFPKDLWTKSMSQSIHAIETDSTENTNEMNPDHKQFSKNLESTWTLVQRKIFHHHVDILGKATFELRSTQAWFDIILQIFRVFVLCKVNKRNTIQQVKVVEMSDKKIVETASVSSMRNYLKRPRGSLNIPIVDSLSSNAYSVQERILLGWLNNHINAKKDIFKQNNKCCCKNRILNNLDKDLSDSVALISVTASHCPYIVSDYFMDVFWRPESPQQVLHNAGRLVQAWRTLQLGLTVETQDIIKPNPVFMIILVTHLYEVLPLLHPRSQISFSAPLNSEVSRTIQIKNDSSQRLVYQAVLFGQYERFFFLPQDPTFEIRPLKSVNVTVLFSAIKIQKISATLLLSGCSTSPDFAKPMVFYLEGEPSDISEYEKMCFCAPLYKVICTEIPIKPPYTASTTYEIWYTTKKPVYLGESEFSFKKWSAIWTTKLARRLFLNKSEITVQGKSKSVLGITVACLTNKKRLFWLLFRSEIGDFIILIEINPKAQEGQEIVRCTYPDDFSPGASCTCLQTDASTLRYAPCPVLGVLSIPCRNEALWTALRKMFLKTLHPQEVSFWDEHLEMDIGICLMLWLLNPDEEEEVLDEFIDILNTKMTYRLSLESPDGQGAIVPSKIEIPDVRSKTEISVPIHFSKETSPKATLRLTMLSENDKEIRTFKIRPAITHECKKKINASVTL